MAKVFDSSAVLAVFYGEPGAEKVRSDLKDGVISAVNASEVITVLVRKGMPLKDAVTALLKTLLEVHSFSLDAAVKTAGLLSPQVRGLDLLNSVHAWSLSPSFPAVDYVAQSGVDFLPPCGVYLS